ncbi:MAG: D-aminoacyl-tRNA deacylase [Bacteroidota bacterium]
MRTIIQRVSQASVTIDAIIAGKIDNGLVVLLGIESSDNHDDIDWLCSKIVNLRIFNDEQGVMNRSLLEVHGEVLVISQFTLHASVKKGNRPSYIRAAKPLEAIPLYNQFIKQIEKLLGKNIHTGQFGAMMQVHLINDGPVTIFIDSRNKE